MCPMSESDPSFPVDDPRRMAQNYPVMDCPVCKKSLIVVERQGIEIDYCLACKGFWFDEGELHLLPQAVGFKADLPDIKALPKVESTQKPHPCPRCRAKMDKVTLQAGSDLILDRCSRGDGIWFDAGELGKMIKAHAIAQAGAGGQMAHFLGEALGIE